MSNLLAVFNFLFPSAGTAVIGWWLGRKSLSFSTTSLLPATELQQYQNELKTLSGKDATMVDVASLLEYRASKWEDIERGIAGQVGCVTVIGLLLLVLLPLSIAQDFGDWRVETLIYILLGLMAAAIGVRGLKANSVKRSEQKARAMFNRAIELRRAHLPPEHSSLIPLLCHYGEFLVLIAENDEALNVIGQIRTIADASSGGQSE